MPASRVHLVRHGEVNNPERILYGRLDGFGLTPRGHEMADTVASHLANQPISAVIASPLLRAQDTAAPIAATAAVPVVTDERLIEGTNRFQGTRVNARTIITTPRVWPSLWNPFRPSWGEPYASIQGRMLQAIDDAAQSVDSGQVVLVSHQLPIWMVHRHLAGQRLWHSPKSRRCTLCSITTIDFDGATWRETGYAEPARQLLAGAIDLGAV